jgi:hypothetical protein
MRATSSWSFWVEQVVVPEELSFVVGQKRWEPGLAVYELPFSVFAVASIGAVVLGLARAFFRELAAAERPACVRRELPAWERRLDYARELFLAGVSAAEELAALSEQRAQRTQQVEWLLREALQVVRSLVVAVLPAAGMAVVEEGTELGRIARDFITVCQHRAVWKARWSGET